MKILSGIPVLQCRHLASTLAFYLDNLRFVIVNRRESEQGIQWVHIMHGETGLMLQQLQADTNDAQISATIELFFFVDDAMELCRFLKSRHIDIAGPVETDYRILQFSIQDPEGNRLTLGQVLSSQAAG